MYALVSSADGAFFEHIRAPVGIAEEAAGLFDDQHSGRQIPGFQTTLPEAVIGAGGDKTEIEGCRAEPSQGQGARHDRGEFRLEARMARLAEVRNPAADERLANVAARRDPEAPISTTGDVNGIGHRIIDK